MPRHYDDLPGDTFAVICRDDRIGRYKGRYVLATRQIFATRAEAVTYARSVAAAREAIVVAGRWGQLRNS